jgi:hypothetical protein
VVEPWPPNCALAAPTVTGLSPDALSVAGGQTVTITGANLQGAQVTLSGIACSAVAADDGATATFSTPWNVPAAPSNALSVANVRGITFVYGQLPSTYALVPGLTALVADGVASDWDIRFVATSDGTNVGSYDAQLHTLLVAYDEEGFWLFAEGGTTPQATNALVIYLDLQYGQPGHPGVSDLRTLTDAAGTLDDACTADLVVADPSFRAQFCAGSVGLSSVAIGEGAPATDAAGLRLLANLADPASLDWGVDGAGGSTMAVAYSTSYPAGAEMHLPWTALGLASKPAGSTIGILARLVSPTGAPLAGQALPPDASAPPTAQLVLPVLVR